MDPGPIPSSDDLQTYWNQVFGKQSNVHFSVSAAGDLPVHYDIQEHDFKLHHVRHQIYENNLEAHAIDLAIDAAFPDLRNGQNMFAVFVTDIQDPTTEGFSVTGNHRVPSFARDHGLKSSKRWVITHEIGHNAGAPHSKTSGTLMFPTDIGGDKCRIGKETWDALNLVH